MRRREFITLVGIDVVWPQFLTIALIGGLLFGLAILRFRSVAAQAT